jgi:RNA polymerase sigma factor (sigma-70 family)
MEWSPGQFEDLARPQIEAAFRLARIMLGSRPDAEDAVQDALTRAWSRGHQLREAGGFRPWFLAIVANQCRSARRSRWWQVQRVAEPEPETAPTEPEDVAGRLDLHSGLGRLSADDRAALLLFYGLDLPLAEVAAALGVSRAAAKSRVFRAAQRLRVQLTEGVPR